LRELDTVDVVNQTTVRCFDLRMRKPMYPSNKITTPKVLDLKQAAAYSGLPVRTLRNLIWDGRIKAVQLTKPNGKIYLPVRELDRLLDQETGFMLFMGCLPW